MKKRLLFSLLAMCMAISGFALTKGEYVYTPQGRFQITGDNLNANNKFQNMTGWTVIGEEKTLADLFNTNANGYADGFNSVVSVDATEGYGMYYKFEPTDASGIYVVSFKMKGAALECIKTRIPGDGYQTPTNLVKVAGNTAGTYTYPLTEEEMIANTAEELKEEWQTFNYAIVGDGTPRIWFISLTSMSTTVEIADLQIAPAMQFADLRQRDAMLEKLNAYKNCYAWPQEKLDDFGYDEAIANLEAIGDETGQATLDEQLATAQEILTEFLNENMDDYLAGNADNYLGIKETSGNTQKVSNIGDWNGPSGRTFWSSGAYPDLGHYSGNNSWNWNSPDTPMGVYMQKTLDPGSYVFAIEANAALREDATSSSWWINEGWDPAYAIAYIAKVVDGAVTDTIVKVVKGLEAVNYTPFILTTKIEESATYEIGLMAYCKDAYKELKNGSVVYVKDASLWGKNNNKYNQKQLTYEKNVRVQITTGRDNLTKAAEYLANAEMFWGKDELKACADTIETKIATYELLTQDEIVATYDAYKEEGGVYAHTTSTEDGLLEYTIYQEAVKYIIAANKKFEAVNDTLSSIQVAIDAAQGTLNERIYDVATGKAALESAIEKAKGVQTQMKAAKYSEANAATIVAVNDELLKAVETFKTTIPASSIEVLADIDFENEAKLDESTNLYSIEGSKGSMDFTAFSTEAAANNEFEKGYWDNGEQKWAGYLRVGNGTGTTMILPVNLEDANATLGTNILRFSFDFFFQGLSGRNIGFRIQDMENNNIVSFYPNLYDNTATDNTLGIALGSLKYGSGSSYDNAAPEGSEGSEEAATVCAKNHFDVIMDYGTSTIYCTTVSANGTVTTTPVAFNNEIPFFFVVQSNYAVDSRRSWFDNLNIIKVKAGAPSGIAVVNAAAKAQTGAVYNLAGQKVNANYKGVVVKDGKKMIQK